MAPWDPTQPPTGAALLSAPIRENFAALDALMGADGAVWPLLAPEGTDGAPSYSFASDPTTGMLKNAGSAVLRFVAFGHVFAIGDENFLTAKALSIGFSSDLYLTRDTAGILAVRGASGIGASVSLKAIATPATPASGVGLLYLKADKKLYLLNDAGTETALF